MDFLWGCGDGLLVDVCVACAFGVVEKKALRLSCAWRLDAGWMRGRRKVGRSRAIASAGLYTAAIVCVCVYVCGGEGSMRSLSNAESEARVTAEVGMQPRPRLQLGGGP